MNGTNLVLATTSGGTATAASPGTADTVTWDGNSGGGMATIAIDMNCTTVTLNTGWSGAVTFSHSQTCSGTVTLTSGTLNTNGQTCSFSTFTANTGSATRSVVLGASTISCSGTGTSWSASSSTGLSVSAASSTIILTGAGCGLSTLGYTYGTIEITGTGGINLNGNSGTVTNFTYAPATAGINNQLLRYGTLTVTGVLTITGSVAPNRVLVATYQNVSHAITCNGSVVLSNCDLQDVAAAGTGWSSATLSGGIGDCLGNTGMSSILTTAQTNYYYAATNGNWSATGSWYLGTGGAGGAGRVPLPQDTAILDANSGNHTVTLDCPRAAGNLTATNYTGTSASSGGPQFFGNVALSPTAFFGGSQLELAGRSSQTFTSNGVTISTNLVMQGIGGTYSQQDNLVVAYPLIVPEGTWNANGHNVTAPEVEDGGSSIAHGIQMGSGTWTLNGTGSVWSITGSPVTITPSTSTIAITNTSSTAKTFAGAGQTYNNLQITPGGTGAVSITGANTFASLVCTGGSKTITMPSSTTTTITGKLNLVGAPSNLITLNASTPSTAATISAVASVLVDCNYLSLKDSTATGGATFYEGVNSSVVSNVSGWTANSYSAANQRWGV